MKTTLLVSMILAAGLISAAAQDIELPPSADTAESSLAASPRHHEIVEVEVPGKEFTLSTFVAFPERADKAPVVIVIHEIFGLTEWAKSIADHLAKQGFIALAPDMISDMTDDKSAIAKVRSLEKDAIIERLNAVHAYALTIPAANGKTGCVGFCWGGSSSFLFAVGQPELDAAVVYYGTAPAIEDLAKIEAPILAHYGEMDARVNVTIGPAEEEMKRLGKTYEYSIYDNGGHGFLRAQNGRDGSNFAATEKAWPSTIEFLRKHTEGSE